MAHDYPVNQLFGRQNQFPPVIHDGELPIGLLNKKDCEYYVNAADARLPKKFDQVPRRALKVREQKQIFATPPAFRGFLK